MWINFYIFSVDFAVCCLLLFAVCCKSIFLVVLVVVLRAHCLFMCLYTFRYFLSVCTVPFVINNFMLGLYCLVIIIVLILLYKSVLTRCPLIPT